MGETCFAISLALSNCRIGVTIGRVLDELVSDDLLDTAYEWLCKRRGDFSPDADIWSFRHRKLSSDLPVGGDSATRAPQPTAESRHGP